MKTSQALTLFLVLLLLNLEFTKGWLWSGSQDSEDSSEGGQVAFELGGRGAREVAERGKEMVAQIRESAESSPCWRAAYTNLRNSCRDIMQDEELKGRLALQLANCFAEGAGRQEHLCPPGKSIKSCVAPMDDYSHATYRSFFIHSAALCHHLQSEAFQADTERIINEVKASADWASGRLQQLAGQSEEILHQTGKSLEAQALLVEATGELQGAVETSAKGLTVLTKALQYSVEDIKNQNDEIKHQQLELADLASDAFDRLENRTERLSNGVQVAIDNQAALATDLGQLARVTKRHVSEAATWQKYMHRTQQKLANGSQAILQAQEAFASRQAVVLSSMDRLFNLHSRLVAHAAGLSSLVFITASAILTLAITAHPRTSAARLPILAGLCMLFAVEVGIVRQLGPTASAESVSQAIQGARGLAGIAALLILLYTALTYRDWGRYACALIATQTAQIHSLEQKLNHFHQTLHPPRPPNQWGGPNLGAQNLGSLGAVSPLGREACSEGGSGTLGLGGDWHSERNCDGPEEESDASYTPRKGVIKVEKRRVYDLRPRPRGKGVVRRLHNVPEERLEDFVRQVHFNSAFRALAEAEVESSSEEDWSDSADSIGSYHTRSEIDLPLWGAS